MNLLYTAHVPAGEGPFPTVLALHGWGAHAHDLLGLAPIFHGGQALVVCPQGPVSVPVGPGLNGYGWFPITMGAPPDPAEFAKGADALRTFLDQMLERYPVDRRKLVLLGFSQGGVMAYDFFLRDPERFAGLAALSSWLPPAVAERAAPAESFAGKPVCVMHGTQDTMIDASRAQESRDLLMRLGVGLTYREYEAGHEITPEGLRDLVTWLDDKVLQPIKLV